MSTGNTIPGPPPFGSEVAILPFAGALWGAICVQTFLYFVHQSKRDAMGLKLLVRLSGYGIQSPTKNPFAHRFKVPPGSSTQDILLQASTEWGQTGKLFSIGQGFLWSLFCDTFASCPVQIFFALRLYRFSGNRKIYLIFFIPIAVAQPILYIVFLAFCYQGNLNSEATLVAVQNLLIAIWSLSAGADVLIAGCLLYYVHSLKTKGVLVGFASADHILDRIIVLTVNTGVWTAIVSVLTIALLTGLPSNPSYTAVTFLICPLYGNTLLANLNSRSYIAGKDWAEPSDSDLPKIAFASRLSAGSTTNATSGRLGTISEDQHLKSATIAEGSSSRITSATAVFVEQV
ncbi:hypothetical protein D9757_006879 [Collybiopsis confluens]|uniref:DUF6534 domain-containing protein n=1 Tax=Collybiopsis confluens TaxID=2823264 RepID=A0A8H5HPU2_9AGAR|nr:hypothetical protein D9757_006879 [Collybiopsis confluens]